MINKTIRAALTMFAASLACLPAAFVAFGLGLESVAETALGAFVLLILLAVPTCSLGVLIDLREEDRK